MWFCKAGLREERWEAKGNNLLGIGKQKFDSYRREPKERAPGNWEKGWSWADGSRDGPPEKYNY